MKKLNKAFVDYQRLINQLRMLRSDLDEATIVREIQKIASTSRQTTHDVLRECIVLGMKGEPMPWEK